MSGEVYSTSPHRSLPARISPTETLVDVAQIVRSDVGDRKNWGLSGRMEWEVERFRRAPLMTSMKKFCEIKGIKDSRTLLQIEVSRRDERCGLFDNADLLLAPTHAGSRI
jgi:hypothetical protein